MRTRVAAAAVVIVALVASARSAHAQAPGQTPIGDDEVPPPYAHARTPALAPLPPEAPRKSPGMALALSFGATAAGVGLIVLGGHDDTGTLIELGVAGVFLGPSAGHLYAGEHKSRGLVIRATGAVVGSVGTLGVLACVGGCSDRQGEIAVGLIIAGGAAIVVGGVWDIVTAPDAADAWNARHAFTVAPTALASPTGVVPGVAVTGRF